MLEEKKDVTNSIVDNYNNELSDPKKFEVKYVPVSPEIVNYDAMKNIIDEISKRYQKTVIQNKDEAYAINKRGGLLTKLRALKNEIEEKKKQVHREAKESYKQMDDDLNLLSKNIELSINSLKDQVDKFQLREYEKNIIKAKNIFDEELNSDQFKGKIPEFYDFDVFLNFNTKIDKETTTKMRKIIVQELAKVYEDNNKIVDKKSKYPSDSYYLTAILKYVQTMDVSESILAGIEQYEQDLKIAERIKQEGLLKEQQEKEKLEQQKQAQTVQTNTDQVNIISEESNQKVYFVMVTEDLKGAKMIKDFAEQNNIKLAFKKVVK